MWTCPRCERIFKTANQSHSCSQATLDELFANRSDELVLAFDRILQEVIGWEPCSVGAAKKAVVFSSKKAWLILRPMTKELDLKFYHNEPIESRLLHKTGRWGNKYAYHVRIRQEQEVTSELLALLRRGHEYSVR